MKNWPKIQYNQVQFGINASLEINEKACDCSLFTGRRYVLRSTYVLEDKNRQKTSCNDSNVPGTW